MPRRPAEPDPVLSPGQPPGAPGNGRWLRFWVAFAVALAFADSSIVVLALPQIVTRLHTSISHVSYVIVAYNVALIAAALAVMPFARRIGSPAALVAGLTVFGVGSLGAGAASSLTVLVLLRCLQGAGGGLLACASLPVFASATRSRTSPLPGWAAAAALGAAIGPAIGGLLTQAFDWRAIFFAQAPVAAFAALAIVTTQRQALGRLSGPAAIASEAPGPVAFDPAHPQPVTANLALAFISAALIGALFLVTTLLINVWQLSPLGAAAVVSAIPLATLLAERTLAGRPPIRLAMAGALALAVGLAGLALVSHRQLAWVLIALILCGAGLGMAFPTLTASALRSSGLPVTRAARTVAARDAGLILGLLILTPVFVNQLKTAPKAAIPPITSALIGAPIPVALKLQIGGGLIAANARASQSQLPNINPTFARAAAQTSGPARATVRALRTRVHAVIETAVTHSFRRPLLICVVFALLAIPALALDATRGSRRRRSPPSA